MLLGKLAEKQQIGTFLKAEVAVLGKSGNQIFDIVTTIEELAVCGNRFTIDNFCGTDFRDLRQSDQDTFSATEEALALTDGLTAEDTVLFLLSGGGSALFERPLVPLAELEDSRRSSGVISQN